MKFLDQAKIYCRSGDGGDGIVAFRRERFIEFGSYQQDRGPAVPGVPKCVVYIGDGPDIESAGRIDHDQNRRVAFEGARDHDLRGPCGARRLGR